MEEFASVSVNEEKPLKENYKFLDCLYTCITEITIIQKLFIGFFIVMIAMRFFHFILTMGAYGITSYDTLIFLVFGIILGLYLWEFYFFNTILFYIVSTLAIIYGSLIFFVILGFASGR